MDLEPKRIRNTGGLSVLDAIVLGFVSLSGSSLYIIILPTEF